jgi:hypothetical protein
VKTQQAAYLALQVFTHGFPKSLLQCTLRIVEPSQYTHEVSTLPDTLPSPASGCHSMYNQGRMLGMLKYHGCMHPRSMQL